MLRPQVLAITRRVLDQVEQHSLECAEIARTEPASAFTSPPRHQADHLMMARTPHVVGWAGEVPNPGDFTTKDVNGVPVLITRHDDGTLRAFVNACAHRGSQVAIGSGTAARFTCPYHAWSYNCDGQLAGVPSREQFTGVDLDGLGLRPLPVSDRAGLITVALDASVDPERLLDDVVDELGGFTYATYDPIVSRSFTVAANWKLVVDVNFEGYHFPFLHRDSLFQLATNHSAFDTFGKHCRWVFPFRGIEQLRDRPEREWPDTFDGTVVYGIFPSCVLIEAEGASQMLRVYPGRFPGEALVTFSAAAHVPISAEERTAHLGGYEIAYDLLRAEDFPAAEACQRGAQHGLEHIVIGRNEPLLQHLHTVWQDGIADIDQRSAGDQQSVASIPAAYQDAPASVPAAARELASIRTGPETPGVQC